MMKCASASATWLEMKLIMRDNHVLGCVTEIDRLHCPLTGTLVGLFPHTLVLYLESRNDRMDSFDQPYGILFSHLIGHATKSIVEVRPSRVNQNSSAKLGPGLNPRKNHELVRALSGETYQSSPEP